MNGYDALAGCYDRFTSDIDYPAWADYVERQFHRWKMPGKTVLDLACGTGNLTYLLAERGYEMIGVDISPDMLAQAAEKGGRQSGGIPPLFLCQPMERLDLYGTIDGCVCCLDSVNHVTRPAQLRQAFQRVHLFLVPGGVFLFDVNTPEKLVGMDGGIYLDETEDAYCVWRADYDRRRRICTFGMDIFQRVDEFWERFGEYHEEYAYTREELTDYLKQAGFCEIKWYGELKLRPPRPGEGRIFAVARKGR